MLLVAARPVALLTSSRRYSVCAIEISFIPDAREKSARITNSGANKRRRASKRERERGRDPKSRLIYMF